MYPPGSPENNEAQGVFSLYEILLTLDHFCPEFKRNAMNVYDDINDSGSAFNNMIGDLEKYLPVAILNARKQIKDQGRYKFSE